MRIAVCAPQVPFERGGTEILVETLVEELRRRGHDTDLVTMPFKWYPDARPLKEALLWRMVDLTEAQGRPIDMVIATKFPSYAVSHPNKVVWLVHQFRQAYDLDRTELGQFGEDPVDRATVHRIQRLDRAALGEARRLFAISRNVADRLEHSVGLEAEVLPPPPQQLEYRSDGYGDFVLSVGRLDRAKRIELVVATKFPSYVVRHPNKVVWLVHQFRQAYDLDRTELGQFGEDPVDRATVHRIQRLDRAALGEARRLFAISRNVADRLEHSVGLEAEVLPPPPQQLEYRSDGYGDFVLSVGRLDRAKRIELLIEAAALMDGVRVVVAGEGPDRERLERLAGELQLDGRVTFAGRVPADDLVDLYARCLAVFYAPVDEDYGFVPYEAFLSEKPVVTTLDAGGPLEVVVDRENGFVCEPSPAAVAEACAWLAANPSDARAWGRSGKLVAERVTWDAVIDRLLGS